MAKPTRYTQEMMDEYFSKKQWTLDTTANLWNRNAKRWPNGEALIDGHNRYTWEHLNLLSDRLGFKMLELGLNRDELVFILLSNCIESYIMRCACEKAGVLCSTALMTIREKEIEHILNSFEAVGIAIPLEFKKFNYFAAVSEMLPRLPKLKHIFVAGKKTLPGTLSISKIMEEPINNIDMKKRFENRKYGPCDVAVIGCTSGTTGMPKGCEHLIAARMALARDYGNTAGLNNEDIVLNIISPVAGLGSAFCYNGSAGLVGAKVILLDIWSPLKTFKLIEKERVTILLAVPAQLAQLVNQYSKYDHNLSSLRCICTSTGPLPSALARELEDKFRVPVLNYYGQFDGGLASTTCLNDPPHIRWTTVGKPPKDNITSLVDDDGNPVPSGEVGEVIYTGPTTSSGYYKDHEGTLKVWGTMGKDGRCRSGDLGKFDKDGNLILVGRKKDIIIRGGQNIFPAEIEGLLLLNPKVKSVAVVPMPDPIMGEKACAYVSLASGEKFTFEEMISFLKSKKIATYKLPERLEIRDELPLRGEHKIAKASLCKDITECLMKEDSFKKQSQDKETDARRREG